MNLIPMPRRIQPQQGVFVVQRQTAIVLEKTLRANDFETARLLQREIKAILSMRLSIQKLSKSSRHLNRNYILLQHDPAITEPEAYRITIRPERIVIRAGDSSGILYGAATLLQLCRTSRGSIGCVEIDDAPSFPHRAYLLDVSRGRIPLMEHLKQQVDTLALYKINQLQLNMESSFRFAGLEEIWSQTDALTPQDILELDQHCLLRGIELVPCLATFGHMYDILRSESFHSLSELDKGVGEPFTWYHRMRYHTLNVTAPESFALVTDLLEQYLPLFCSNKINICCDETFDLGKGKSAAAVQQSSYAELYFQYVNQLTDWLHQQGKEVMLWADIILHHKEQIGLLNEQVTCLNWYYYESAEEETVRTIQAAGFGQYVCPSVSGYNRLVPAYDLSFHNIREMAQLGGRCGARGVLNTDWGDTGHVNMPALAVPCMIYGAALSWNVHDNREVAAMDKTISLLEYNDWDGNLVALLRELSRQDHIIFNDLVLFRDFKLYGLQYREGDVNLYSRTKDRITNAGEGQLTAAIARCGELLENLRHRAAGICSSRQLAMEELFLAASGVALFQELALNIKKYEYGQGVAPPRPPSLLAECLERWLSDYCTAWRAGSRESELHRIKEFVFQLCSILRRYRAD